MLCSGAFYLILAGDLLLAYSIEVGSREQTGSLNSLEFFLKLQGAGKCKAVMFGVI